MSDKYLKKHAEFEKKQAELAKAMEEAFMDAFWGSHFLYKLVLQAFVLYRYKPWEHRQHGLLVTY